jgi:hypothetical protein
VFEAMDKNGYKGLLEQTLVERRLQLWKAIVESFGPVYTHKNWTQLNKLAIRKIHEGTFSEHCNK